MSPARAMPNKPAGPVDQGPIGFVMDVVVGLVLGSLFSWAIGVIIEVAGSYTSLAWPDRGVEHARALVEEDLEFTSEYPRSIIINDTVAFERRVAGVAAWPFERLGLVRFYQSSLTPVPETATGIKRAILLARGELGKAAAIGMYVAMDVSMRLWVIVFALPAFALACLLGTVDGLVRRDLRRWGGGRESSFVYHRAKKAATWALTGGFGLYLAWPIGGFNPAYMVLVFTALVAASLSVTVSSFKKYV